MVVVQRLCRGGFKETRVLADLLPFFGLSTVIFERILMSKARQAIIDSQERLVSAIRSEISDVEDVLSATTGEVGEKITRLRERLQKRLSSAKLRLAEAEERLVAKTKAAARATDNYVHESPWTSIGIAAGVGVVAGLLFGRR